MTAREKLFAAILLFIAWGALVLLGKAPAADLITGIRDALIALGVFQAVITDPKG